MLLRSHGPSTPMTDSGCHVIHTLPTCLPRLPRLPFLQNGHADRLFPSRICFCLSHHFTGTTCSGPSGYNRLLLCTRCLRHAHAHTYQGQTHTHTLTQISRGQDLTEATQPISLQIRLITLQRGPVNNPHRGC